MPRAWVPGLSLLIALSVVRAATPAGGGLKPGLWEVQVVKQVVDGHDISAQLQASLTEAQRLLNSLPPAQRAHLMGLLNQAGVTTGTDGSFRICVSPQMAQRDLLFFDRDGRCRPSVTSRSGNQLRFRVQCTTQGTTMTGQGQATLGPDLITSRMDLTTRSGDGASHAVQNVTQMRYISGDCGELRPPSG